MDYSIKTIKNNPIDSNCYIVYELHNKNCFVIDPGCQNTSELISFILDKHLKLDFLILTHEHFDHIWGVNDLKKIFKTKIICSSACAENISSSKKNMSVFYNQIGFSIKNVDLLLEELDWKLFWNNTNIRFFKAEGHSHGSICIYFNDIMFTGDTLIKGEKTVTKLVGGSKLALCKTLDKIFNFDPETIIFPGHGTSFTLKDVSINDYL